MSPCFPKAPDTEDHSDHATGRTRRPGRMKKLPAAHGGGWVVSLALFLVRLLREGLDVPADLTAGGPGNPAGKNCGGGGSAGTTPAPCDLE